MKALSRLAQKLDSSGEDLGLAASWVAPYIRANPEGGPFGPPVHVSGYHKTLADIIKEVADAWGTAANEREPTTTELVRNVASEIGGELGDLSFRLKSVGRIREKVETEAVRNGLLPNEVQVKDALRYTMVFDVESYADSTKTALKRLEDEGFKLDTKNWWEPGDAYNGLNVAMTSPDGFPIELQFHTKDSFRISRENHAMYEQFRTLTLRGLETDDERERLRINAQRRMLWEAMVERADRQTIPEGIEGLPTERWDAFDDLPGLPAVALPEQLAAPLTAEVTMRARRRRHHTTTWLR